MSITLQDVHVAPGRASHDRVLHASQIGLESYLPQAETYTFADLPYLSTEL